jgi:hypothetical protein
VTLSLSADHALTVDGEAWELAHVQAKIPFARVPKAYAQIHLSGQDNSVDSYDYRSTGTYEALSIAFATTLTVAYIHCLEEIWDERNSFCAVASAQSMLQAFQSTRHTVAQSQVEQSNYPADAMSEDDWAEWFTQAPREGMPGAALLVEEPLAPKSARDEMLVPLEALRFAGSTVRRRTGPRSR